MRTVRALAAVAVTIATSHAAAAADKKTRFWNLTANTVTSFRLAPAGSDAFGPNQCVNDKDGTVDHDERLRLTAISSGRYDARLTDKTGRTCTVRGIEVREGEVFSIEEKDLTDCRR